MVDIGRGSGLRINPKATNIFHPIIRKDYPIVDRGEGIYLYDTSGKRYIDGCSGVMVSNIGHGVEEVSQAMRDQARKLAFSHYLNFLSEPWIKLTKSIAEMAPGSLKRIFLVSGGSEATETAIKLARQYHLEKGESKKYKVIGRWLSYHGNTLGALSATGHALRRKIYIPLLLDFPHIPPPFCYRCPFKKEYPECDVECARELERAVLREGQEYISAFIAEPIIGAAGGAICPVQEYYAIIREICDRYGILFIADEVITAFGRAGRNFGIEHWGVVPDVVVAAKSMGAGYTPLGAMIVKEEVYEVFEKGSGLFSHGYTYSANPLSCAVGLAVIDYVKRKGLVKRAEDMGRILFEKVEEIREHNSIGDIRGKGLLLGIEFVKDKAKKEPFPTNLQFAERVRAKCLEEGLVVYPGTGTVDGVAGDHILIAPPLTIESGQIEEMIDILNHSLGEVEKTAA